MNTDWTPQEDWSTVKVGDQVRVTRDGGMLTGKAKRIHVMNDRSTGIEVAFTEQAGTRFLAWSDEWTLSVPAKPAVVLPTVPGIYMDCDETSSVWEVDKNGRMSVIGGYGHIPEEYAPFTKLEPVAVTAKKFVEAYRAYSSGTNRTAYLLDQAVREVASKEFGADE